MHVYVVDEPGTQESRLCVSLLSPEHMFGQGLSPEAIVGAVVGPLGPEKPITPDVFAAGREFRAFLHAFVARRAPGQPEFQAAARGQATGWLYFVDQRTQDPAGQVPVEDIVGTFALHDGVMVPGSYQPNPRHLILSWHGWFQLGPTLDQLLLQDLIERNAQWHRQVENDHRGWGDSRMG